MNTKNLILAATFATALVAGTAAYAQDGAPAAPAPAAPTEFVYAPKLPSVAEINGQAASQNISVLRVDQTADKVVVAYRYPNGSVVTVAYMALPAGAEAPAVPPPAAGAPVTTTTVVYSAPASYYPYYGYPYYGWGWWPPVAVGVGFGWGWHGGGWRR